jgi:predicted amidohydrolase
MWAGPVGRREIFVSKSIVAAVQWAPEVLNPVAGGEKAAAAVTEAAGRGARLAVFPECWLQGYPYWSGLAPTNPEYQAFRQLSFETGIAVDDPSLEPVYEAARTQECTVVLGLHEKEGGTLYCTLLYIGPDGRMLGKHRKLIPTQAERLVWGRGDGSDMDVYDTPVGRLGGLNCFEHQMAPARIALSGMNMQVHAAAWPGHAFLDPIIDASTRHLAHENACFVVVAREVMSPDRVPSHMPLSEAAAGHWTGHGGSAIIAPGGRYLAEPVFDQETIVIAEIDLAEIAVNKWFFDGTGHYARPDVFQLRWDKRPKPAVHVIE